MKKLIIAIVLFVLMVCIAIEIDNCQRNMRYFDKKHWTDVEFLAEDPLVKMYVMQEYHPELRYQDSLTKIYHDSFVDDVIRSASELRPVKYNYDFELNALRICIFVSFIALVVSIFGMLKAFVVKNKEKLTIENYKNVMICLVLTAGFIWLVLHIITYISKHYF